MITLETALTSARQALTTVAERADRQGYYTGARTDIINSHAELRAALDLLIKAAAPETPDTCTGASNRPARSAEATEDASGGDLGLRDGGKGPTPGGPP